jgi:hypothetical protein
VLAGGRFRVMAKKKLDPRIRRGEFPARLFMIVARKSPTVVILRRGPTQWVQLIKWDTDTDTLQLGQWFHGRIYEKRCDLSPDGSLLIYFAQKMSMRALKDTKVTHSWTAISKPPFLTALALWPKGQSWDGGGLFKDDKTVLLNHEPSVAKPHPDHMPKRLHVILKECGYGGDEPIFSERLERDGWNLTQEWKGESLGLPYYFRTVQPEIREKSSGLQKIRMTRSRESGEEFAVVSGKGLSIGVDSAGWVDWDKKGRLVVAREGRISVGHIDGNGHLTEKALIDLNSSKPTPLVAPQWAQTW